MDVIRDNDDDDNANDDYDNANDDDDNNDYGDNYESYGKDDEDNYWSLTVLRDAQWKLVSASGLDSLNLPNWLIIIVKEKNQNYDDADYADEDEDDADDGVDEDDDEDHIEDDSLDGAFSGLLPPTSCNSCSCPANQTSW